MYCSAVNINQNFWICKILRFLKFIFQKFCLSTLLYCLTYIPLASLKDSYSIMGWLISTSLAIAIFQTHPCPSHWKHLSFCYAYYHCNVQWCLSTGHDSGAITVVQCKVDKLQCTLKMSVYPEYIYKTSQSHLC